MNLKYLPVLTTTAIICCTSSVIAFNLEDVRQFVASGSREDCAFADSSVTDNSLFPPGVPSNNSFAEDPSNIFPVQTYRTNSFSTLQYCAPSCENCDLSGIQLGGSILKRANLSGADLSKAQLSATNLSQVNLSGANLEGAYLYSTFLRQADLMGANLANANLIGAILRQANLSGANLASSDLSAASLWQATLRETTLAGANLRGAALREADLTMADLSGTDLRRANLEEAILVDANLVGANLEQAYYDDATQFPNGFDPSSAGMVRLDEVRGLEILERPSFNLDLPLE